MASGMQKIAQIASQFRYLLENDRTGGEQVVKLLNRRTLGLGPADLADATAIVQTVQSHGGPYAEVLQLYLRMCGAAMAQDSAQELDLIISCLKACNDSLLNAGKRDPGNRLLPFLMYISAEARHLAIKLDKGSSEHFKKLVEVNRDYFQKYSRSGKMAVYCWICCELLRAYFRLDQILACSHLLKNVEPSLMKEGATVEDLPKAIAVSLYYYWGRFSLLNKDFSAANEKLTWALKNCRPSARQQKRAILLYLVPCKLRLGILPRKELIEEHELWMYRDIVKAIVTGNVKLFTESMQLHSTLFLKMRLYMLMMQLQTFAWRNLCKGVHAHFFHRDGDVQQDLTNFEHIFKWQVEDYDADMTACQICRLLNMGAIMGYTSFDRRKLVFARQNPFPGPSKWARKMKLVV